MPQTWQDAACDERRPTGPTTGSAPSRTESTHSVADATDIPRGEWWRMPSTAYAQGLRDGYARGMREGAARAYGQGWRSGVAAFVNLLAGDRTRSAPLWTAGEVIRRLVRDLSRETAPAGPRTGRGGPDSAGRVGLDAWPGEDALSADQRVAAQRRRLATWDRPW